MAGKIPDYATATPPTGTELLEVLQGGITRKISIQSIWDGVAGSVTLATWSGTTNLTTLGTVTVGTWNATAIGPTKGGTGLTSYATGDIIYASAANTLAKRSIGSTNYLLQSVGGIPVWADVLTPLNSAISAKAPASGATLTDNPTAPTQAADNNTARIATTAFVVGQAAAALPLVAGTVSVGTSLRYARADHVHPVQKSRTFTEASNVAPATNVDLYDRHTITALLADAVVGAPSGTPTDGQKLEYRFKDNATARAISFNAIFRNGPASMPTTTIVSKGLYILFEYNSQDEKWDCMATGSVQ